MGSDIEGGSQGRSGKSSNKKEMKDGLLLLPTEIDKLKNRVRAFTGAFVVMISPVLLGIVLKKVNLAGAGKYQGIRRLEAFIDFVQGSFAHLAAATLQMGILPFLCVMISEAFSSLSPLSYVAKRMVTASKVLVFASNISLLVLGCGILLLIHNEALLVLSLCSIMGITVIVVHVIWYRCCANVVEATKDNVECRGEKEKEEEDAEYHSKLEHLLELSAGVTVMMFLVLEGVALEGLLRNNSQGQGLAGFLPHPLAPAPAQGPVAKGQAETFLGATLIISFMTSAFGVLLMNVWTTPLVVSNSKLLTTEFKRGLSVILQALPITAVVILITLEVLPHTWKPAVWLPVFPPFIVLLMLLARDNCEDDSTQPKRKEKVATAGAVPETGSSASPDYSGKAEPPKDPEDQNKPKDPDLPEDQKPAPLELTKVAFTGFLAVAMPSATNASVGVPSIFFVLFTATAVLLGLLWRLLTHEAKPTEAVLKAANHASFFAHTFVSFAGVAFWVMAVNASK